MTIWSIIFVHYLGQYLMLKMMSVPVTSYRARWFKVYLEYQFWHVRQEIAVVVAGPLACSVFFVLMTLFTWLC